MKSIKDILKNYSVDGDKQVRISREWQDYGYRLALELDDLKHKSLYMKLAKTADRALLEETRLFVKGAIKAKNKGALFMWKMREIRQKKRDGK
jgi:hypothetical protein